MAGYPVSVCISSSVKLCLCLSANTIACEWTPAQDWLSAVMVCVMNPCSGLAICSDNVCNAWCLHLAHRVKADWLFLLFHRNSVGITLRPSVSCFHPCPVFTVRMSNVPKRLLLSRYGTEGKLLHYFCIIFYCNIGVCGWNFNISSPQHWDLD